MSEFLAFFQLGIRHIIDVRALDHVLFLFALSAIYTLTDWREIVRVVTAFTIGHSITLAAAVVGYQPLSSKMVEFLIPLTIVATCIENVLVRDRTRTSPWRRYRPLLAGAFGLVHGAGFGNYLQSLFVEQVALPLLAFNVGIEVGQIAALVSVFAIIALLDRILVTAVRPPLTSTPVRVRVVGISAVVFTFATRWAVERVPW